MELQSWGAGNRGRKKESTNFHGFTMLSREAEEEQGAKNIEKGSSQRG